MSIAEPAVLQSNYMNFLDNPMKVDATTDIIYIMCPMHLLTIEEQVKEIKVGQTVSILTDYDGALEDIPAWCAKTGNEFLGLYEEEDHYEFYIRKIRES
ncbi:sulfurtransferase TusA family protein [bacterium]|nr:sulfurtransferase TusA family protein [bacterium]